MEISKVKMRILVAFQNRSFLTNSLTRPPTHTHERSQAQRIPSRKNVYKKTKIKKNGRATHVLFTL